MYAYNHLVYFNSNDNCNFIKPSDYAIILMCYLYRFSMTKNMFIVGATVIVMKFYFKFCIYKTCISINMTISNCLFSGEISDAGQ